MQNSSDETTRRIIAEVLDQNFMVEAAAGTGKTTSIVKRMVNLVAEGVCAIEHLAAVTFTRKAAAELEQRFVAAVGQRLEELRQQCQATTSNVDPAAHAGNQARLARLEQLANSLGLGFVDTIHGFCGRLIRERPIEFGVDPGFVELEATAEATIRREAWEQNLAELKAAHDPLLGQLAEVGLRSSQLRGAFDDFLNYRDVTAWPIQNVPPIDPHHCRRQTIEFLDSIKPLVADFGNRKRDDLMDKYESVDRFRLRLDSSDRTFFDLLALFDRKPKIVQKCWTSEELAKQELARFNSFRDDVALPALTQWRRYRYQFVVRFIRRAVECYERLKASQVGLDFTDLLLITARGLRTQPHLRRYFQQRFSHLLVDEFQDTDPVQAEIVVLLGSQDIEQTDWRAGRLRPGCLFIVGDPKQSIYRFRRGDIVTYNQVKSIFSASDAQVLQLSRNFRSSPALIQWNNYVFEEIFETNDQNREAVTPHAPMTAGHERPQPGELAGVFKLSIPDKERQIIDWEAAQVTSFIRLALDRQWTIEVRETASSEQWITRAVQPSDFLILMRNKKHIHRFKSELEQAGLECDVTGSNALVALEELHVLELVLQAVDDAYNPVPYLAILRDHLFGLSDAELYEFKSRGGTFQFTAPLPTELSSELRERFAKINRLLSDSQRWLRTLPPAIAITKIATALGLLASAAAASEGNLALGTLLKAIEMLRQRSWQFDSAADMITGLQELFAEDEFEGLPACAPSGKAIRLMNLHKAKGLEAPIVFLVDGTKRNEYPPKHYIDRSSDQPQGYMWITERINFATKPLAEPGDWQDLQATEQRFQAAEEDRLLYVATTRAANMLVITSNSAQSTWANLEPYLAKVPELSTLTDALSDRPSASVSVAAAASSAQADSQPSAFDQAAYRQAWQQALRASYQTSSVKQESVRGRARPPWQSSGDYGAAWGTAIHQLLDMAQRVPTLDVERQALSVALENGIDANRVAELVTAIGSVMASTIWRRAQASQRKYSEVPFDTLEHHSGMPGIVRGVIDLVFEEPDGWVIIDYKSDNILPEGIPDTFEYYRGQLEAYCRYWEQLTGSRVKEYGIYLTRLDQLCCHLRT